MICHHHRRASHLLLAFGLTLATGAQAASQSCFKPAFKRGSSAGAWSVSECEVDNGVKLEISLRDANSMPHKAVLKPIDTDGKTGTDYSLVAPDTLLIDVYAERGGEAVLAHPIAGGSALSVVKFAYHGTDMVGLSVRQSGNVIRATTDFDDNVYLVDAKGVLNTVRALHHDTPGSTIAVCEAAQKSAKGQTTTRRLQVETMKGAIVGVAYTGTTPSPAAGQATTCEFKLVSAYGDSFSRAGRVTAIASRETGRKAAMRIEEANGGWKATFGGLAQSNYCATGGPFPQSMTLGADKKCLVQP